MPSAGQLLIAGPALLDPNFRRTVVLVIEHSEEGALGLVLNRSSESTVGEVAPELEPVVDPDSVIFMGGPVQPSGVIILARFERPEESALVSFDDVGVLRAELTGCSPAAPDGPSFRGPFGVGSRP